MNHDSHSGIIENEEWFVTGQLSARRRSDLLRRTSECLRENQGITVTPQSLANRYLDLPYTHIAQFVGQFVERLSEGDIEHSFRLDLH